MLFFVLQFIATYFGGSIIITISLHTYMFIFNKCIQTLKKNKTKITLGVYININIMNKDNAIIMLNTRLLLLMLNV